LGVPQRFFEGHLGSAKFFEAILGSATSKRLKNTGLHCICNSFSLLLKKYFQLKTVWKYVGKSPQTYYYGFFRSSHLHWSFVCVIRWMVMAVWKSWFNFFEIIPKGQFPRGLHSQNGWDFLPFHVNIFVKENICNRVEKVIKKLEQFYAGKIS